MSTHSYLPTHYFRDWISCFSISIDSPGVSLELEGSPGVSLQLSWLTGGSPGVEESFKSYRSLGK